MKKLLFSIAALTLSFGVFAQKKADEVAKFNSETIDLGKIKQDNPTAATFEVTNIGKEPLLIEQANPTCGCTISDYTKEPIAPGKTGYIKATYNAKNLGMFEKHLNVKFAGYDMQGITIKGEVIKNEDAAVAAPAVAPATAPMEMASEKMVAEKAPDAAPTKTAAPAKSAAPVKKTNKTAPVKKP